MNVLFILSGALCAIIAAILGSNTPKEAIYFIILIAFFTFLLAYLFLSVAKFYISRIEFLNNTKIVSWGTYSPKRRKFPFIVSGVAGLIFGILLIFQRVEYTYSLLLALALAFESLGWQLCALKRFDAANTSSFILAHLGMLYNNKISIFNRTTNGITSCKREENTLYLTVLNKKKERNLFIEIPEDKISEVDAFLIDMKEFFNGEE